MSGGFPVSGNPAHLVRRASVLEGRLRGEVLSGEVVVPKDKVLVDDELVLSSVAGFEGVDDPCLPFACCARPLR